MVTYVLSDMWAPFKGPSVTGWVSNGTMQVEANTQERIKESDTSHVKANIPQREALREKYASEFENSLAQNASVSSATAQSKAIEISGKVVEEVGFDKIREQLAELQELRIVLLDGLRVVGVLASYNQAQVSHCVEAQKIGETCPKITELDLSRSLLSRWRDVWDICNQLKHLKKLKLNGNRFQAVEDDLTFKGIIELHLEETLLSWDEIAAIVYRFPGLTSLTASANQLSEITCPLPSTITILTLEHNEITSISALRHLATLPKLEHLSIRGNGINTVNQTPTDTTPDFQFPPTLRSLDLSRNNITSWTVLNKLPTVFPGLTTLRITANPLFDQPPLPPSVSEASNPMTVDEAFMLTLSRFPSSLTTLNYSTISPQDRSNAEMYYLSLIGKELSATSEEEEPVILATHPRYSELCELYVEPTITRAVVSDSSGARVIHPRSVAARLVKMAFRLPLGNDESKCQIKEIPGSFDTYQIKALVSRLFGLPAFGFRLIWETDEWDPVEREIGDEGVVEWDEDSEDEDRPGTGSGLETTGGSPDQSRFVRREVELVDSTRDVGFLFQGEVGEVRIRVETLGFASTR
ncbi:Tubulin-specific chaperone, putative [Penicillium digitatum PHI26]|uniref:Tubulin-specific chaperone, putative n=2 Tax=Penicillium digitatum TaxID=36651 RepID=K9FGZ4_PEND2|nr:Tubulin-specific chaperone, putative [Penicillium digitatum Pd1]EKV07377.1 Tubulin-specific chaperone, putative [Penicillium digitatum PHI26]EKV14590.1 Tubulin-specific chaperone, putative [Penicillium digitatum Pd1]